VFPHRYHHFSSMDFLTTKLSCCGKNVEGDHDLSRIIFTKLSILVTNLQIAIYKFSKVCLKLNKNAQDFTFRDLLLSKLQTVNYS